MNICFSCEQYLRICCCNAGNLRSCAFYTALSYQHTQLNACTFMFVVINFWLNFVSVLGIQDEFLIKEYEKTLHWNIWSKKWQFIQFIVRFEFLIVVTMKITIFYDVTPCSLLHAYQFVWRDLLPPSWGSIIYSGKGCSRFLWNVYSVILEDSNLQLSWI